MNTPNRKSLIIMDYTLVFHVLVFNMILEYAFKLKVMSRVYVFSDINM